MFFLFQKKSKLFCSVILQMPFYSLFFRSRFIVMSYLTRILARKKSCFAYSNFNMTIIQQTKPGTIEKVLETKFYNHKVYCEIVAPKRYLQKVILKSLSSLIPHCNGDDDYIVAILGKFYNLIKKQYFHESRIVVMILILRVLTYEL